MHRVLNRAPVCAALTLFVGAAFAAEAYPARPVRLVVPYSPGGAADVLERIAEGVSRILACRGGEVGEGGEGERGAGGEGKRRGRQLTPAILRCRYKVAAIQSAM